MAVVVSERFISRNRASGDNPRIRVRYLITGTADDAVAQVNLQNNAAAVVDGYPMLGVEVDQVGDADTFEGTVTYGPSRGGGGDARGDDVVFSFTTGGATQHIKQSLQTMDRFAFLPWTVAQNHYGAINVTESGVEGVDIVVPRFEWTQGHFFPAEHVDAAFRGRLYFLTGTVNDRAWGDLKAGEGLFLGADGARRQGPNGPDWQITYRFAASPNATTANQLLKINYGNTPPGSNVGANDKVVVKEGWDYFWIRYADAIDDDATRSLKRPMAGYVERVYRRANWNDPTTGLGIPSTAYVPAPYAPGGIPLLEGT